MRGTALASFRKPIAARIALAATRALYVGPPLGVGFHRGAVTCFALALDGALRITTGSPRTTTPPVRCALIAAGMRHQIDVTGDAAAFLYVDPADALVAALRARMRPAQRGVELAHPRAAALARALIGGAGLEVFAAPAPAPLDPRIERVVAALRGGEWLDADAAVVARAVGLSASRFMYLFRANTGVPFRRYRMWARLHVAVRQFGAGASWTTAAMDSSFASSSHLTDVFRSMFGVAPSALRGIQLAFG